MEITSATIQENDEIEKPLKYAALGAQEYFQYDPIGDYLNPQLKGRSLVEGKYQAIAPTLLADGVFSIYSQVLSLDLRVIDGELRFYNPRTEKLLLSHKETEQARQTAEQARLDAISQLLELGLSVEQVAKTLTLSVDEVRRFAQ